VPDASSSRSPSPLRPAPSRASTPLPGSFALTEDSSTEEFDDGAVLLGGSPLRLFRITPRGHDLVARWRSGAVIGDAEPARRLARRFVSAGVFSPESRAATLGPDDVTIVVPVRNRPGQLARLLDALTGLSCVVVDDASIDAGASKDIAERHGARFVGLTTNSGPSAARNAGLTLVDTALVAFVDSDCVPADGWLQPLLGLFDDPLVAAVAPRVVSPPERTSVLARYERVRPLLDQGRTPAPVRPGGRVSYVPSAAIVVRADLAEGPDLFDPSLRGGEDVDLVWRLTEAGWDVRYVPRSVVTHDGPRDVHSFLARRSFYGSTAAPLSRRHRDHVRPVEVSGWSLAVWAFALAGRPTLALTTLEASIAVMADRLSGLVRDPVGVATRIAGRGTARAALPALGGLARAWSPALVLALACRRTRRHAALALVLPALNDWAANPEALDPIRFTALHVFDDVAYGAGVWAGCARERVLEPLLPRVVWQSRTWSAITLRQSLGTTATERPTRQPLA
jgi:mycofactocin system glycosyltransferase